MGFWDFCAVGCIHCMIKFFISLPFYYVNYYCICAVFLLVFHSLMNPAVADYGSILCGCMIL